MLLPVNPLYFYTAACLMLTTLLGAGCDGNEPEIILDYKITGFQTEILTVDQLAPEYGEIGGVILKEADTVKFDHLAFSFESRKNAGGNIQRKSSHLPAFFPPKIFSPYTTDSIAKISVFSDHDFDENFRAGDDLSEKFIIMAEGSSPGTCINSTINLASYFTKPQPGSAAFLLMLAEKPDLNTTHQFTVHYRKTDKSLYIFQFPIITVY